MNSEYKNLFKAIDDLQRDIVKTDEVYHADEHRLILKFEKDFAQNIAKKPWVDMISAKAIKSDALAKAIFNDPRSTQDLLTMTLLRVKEKDVLIYALKQPLSDIYYEYCYSQNKEEIDKMLQNYTSEFAIMSNGTIYDRFGDGFIEYIAMKYRDVTNSKILNFIRGDNTAKTLIETDELTEEELSYIANNSYISADIRNKAFYKGCDYNLIKNFTSEMVEDVLSSTKTLLLEFDEKDIPSKTIIADASKTITNLIKSGQTTSAQEKELLDTAVGKENWDLTTRIITNTTHTDIIDKILLDCTKRINSKYRRQIYNNLIYNKNLSKEHWKVLASISKPPLYDNALFVNKVNENGTLYCKIIANTELETGYYAMFIKNKIPSIIQSMSASQNTPRDILEEMLKIEDVPQESLFFALLNKYCKDFAKEDMFPQLYNMLHTRSEHALAHRLNSLGAMMSFCDMCERVADETSDKYLEMRMRKIASNTKEEYNIYATMKKYPDIFHINKNDDMPTFKNFNIKIQEVTYDRIKEAFEKLPDATLIEIQHKIASEMREYMFGQMCDESKFYKKLDDANRIYETADAILKERDKYIDKEEVAILAEIESMTVEQMENYCRDYEYDDNYPFEHTEYEDKKYNLIKSHYLSDPNITEER